MQVNWAIGCFRTLLAAEKLRKFSSWLFPGLRRSLRTTPSAHTTSLLGFAGKTMTRVKILQVAQMYNIAHLYGKAGWWRLHNAC
jgi:hypothetical protein